MRGSMEKKSSTKKPAKGKAKDEDPFPPFQPSNLKATSTCFVDEAILHEKGTCIFKGNSKMPKTRSEGEKVQVAITEATVRDALKFAEGYKDLGRHLTDVDKDKIFLHLPGKAGTFDDMAIHKEKLPLKLFTQHFNLRKPARFIRPHLRVTHNLSLATLGLSQARPNFSKHVLDSIKAHSKSSSIKTEPCLYAGHMLTRIAYHALGMDDELPPPLSQSAMPKPLKERTKSAKGKAVISEEEESSSSGEEEELEIP
ncbi:hypothetical protein GOP47_0023777 [Adiantum capillus-veneris]|uniref:Uncharacterized protein n=1 Tax=Adiantum capillus-veneris TaxID=13818 RepID=A0A9D4U581_ADICA|nr:hypothetical protein GOP47_0023777 [Adiantum capillus-veneris]